MNICIIGSGNVGGTLGSRFAKEGGHKVVFGARNPNSNELKQLLSEAGPNTTAASVADAAKASDVVLLATPWGATKNAIESAGDLSGKIVIDATNPLLPDLSGLEVGRDSSAGELVAQWAQGAKVVKAFNTVGNNVMADSKFVSGRVAMFYCGDDTSAKKVAAGLATELGFDALDAGPLSQCRVLEPFALLWISLAFKAGFGREIGFQFMRRGA